LTRRQTARDASRRIAKRKLRDFRVARVALAEDPRLWFLGEPLEPRLAGDDSDEDDCFDGPIEGRKVVLAIDEMLREAYCVPQELRGVGAFRARTTPQLPQTADFCSSRVAAIADESVIEWVHAVAVDPLSLIGTIRDDSVQLDSLRSLWVRTIGPLSDQSVRYATLGLDAELWLNCIQLAVLSCPLWVRPLSTWQGDSARSLLEHLLVLYAVPDVLYDWMLSGLADPHIFAPVHAGSARARIAWSWFVARAQGASARRVLRSIGVDVSDSLVAAVERAENAWLRSVDHLVNAHPALDGEGRSGPTEDQAVPPELFVETARWVISQRNRMTDEQAIAVLRWARHEASEAYRARLHGNTARQFSWKGRTARSAMAAAQRHFDGIRRARAAQSLSWGSHGWNWEWTEDSTPVQSWQLVELLSSEQLANEGAALSHCVGSYARECAVGSTAIFQLLRNGARQLTIEVAVPTREVRQVRGRLNSPAWPDDRQVVMQWAEAQALHVSMSAW
jgi:PcfJ-like protein